MMALVRKIVSGDEDEKEAVEEVFAQARDGETTAEELLVDDGWKAVENLPRAGHGGNGHETDIFGPTVELAPVNGHANENGANGYHAAAEESQQSLFSWAEFMAEVPVKPKRRNGKPQPASMSMFEWAMELEREKETVGAGR